jgi:hypothetical protein
MDKITSDKVITPGKIPFAGIRTIEPVFKADPHVFENFYTKG